MVKTYLPQENIESLHDALQDIIVLKKLVESLGIFNKDLKDECQSINQLQQLKENKAILEKNKALLQIFKDFITPQLINKMAREGINQRTLIDA